MHRKICLIIISIFMVSNGHGETDAEARARILRQYGNSTQYENVIDTQNTKSLKRKLKNIQRKLKEPLVNDPKLYRSLNVIEKERYIKRRKKEREDMSSFLLKHHHLLEKEAQNKILAQKKKKEILESEQTVYDNQPGEIIVERGSVTNLEQVKKIAEQNKIKLDDNVFTGLLKGESKSALAEMLNSNPFEEMSLDQVKQMILIRTEGSRLNNWLKKNPVRLEAFAELVKDEKALPSLIEILNKSDKLTKYAMGCVFIFLVGIFINLKNSDKSMIKKIILKLSVTVATLGCNVLLFYFVFKDEVSPAWNIIKKAI